MSLYELKLEGHSSYSKDVNVIMNELYVYLYAHIRKIRQLQCWKYGSNRVFVNWVQFRIVLQLLWWLIHRNLALSSIRNLALPLGRRHTTPIAVATTTKDSSFISFLHADLLSIGDSKSKRRPMRLNSAGLDKAWTEALLCKLFGACGRFLPTFNILV